MMIPVNSGAHWSLVVVDIEVDELKYYDSMGGTNKHCLDRIW